MQKKSIINYLRGFLYIAAIHISFLIFLSIHGERYGYIAPGKMAQYGYGIKYLLITFDNPKHCLVQTCS